MADSRVASVSASRRSERLIDYRDGGGGTRGQRGDMVFVAHSRTRHRGKERSFVKNVKVYLNAQQEYIRLEKQLARGRKVQRGRTRLLTGGLYTSHP